MGGGRRRWKAACAFHTPLVVMAGEPVHGDDPDLADRIVQQLCHAVGKGGIAVLAIGDRAAGSLPHLCVGVGHQTQQRLPGDGGKGP